MEDALHRLEPTLLADDTFATELYAALCNIDWEETTSSRKWSCSWRSSGGIVADLRGKGEDYLDFYCSGGEGRVSLAVREALAALGWQPIEEHGNQNPYTHDPNTGQTRVIGSLDDLGDGDAE